MTAPTLPSARMQPPAADSPTTAELRQCAFMQLRTPSERLAFLCEWSGFALAQSRQGICRRYPHLSLLAQARLLISAQFDADRALQLQRVPHVEEAMSIPAAIIPVVQVFDALAVPYYIGGSVAGSAYSIPRATYDVDFAAALEPKHIGQFVQQLNRDYYVDASSILDAITYCSSFNMTHQGTGINIDVFIPACRPFDAIQFARAQLHLLPGSDQMVKLASPEDVVLNKLAWYELGNRVSDVQWRDVQAILRVQDTALAYPYLESWATTLGLKPLLDAALRGERPPPPPALPRQQRMF